MAAPSAPVEARFAQWPPGSTDIGKVDTKIGHEATPIETKLKRIRPFDEKTPCPTAVKHLHGQLTGEMVVAYPRLAHGRVFRAGTNTRMALLRRQPHHAFKQGGNLVIGQRKVSMPALFALHDQRTSFELRQMRAGRCQADTGDRCKLARRQRLTTHQGSQHIGPRRITDQGAKTRNIRSFFHCSTINEAYSSSNALCWRAGGGYMPDTSTVRWREFALLGCLALLWGSSYLFIGIGVREIPPLTLIAIRVGVAAVFLLSVIAWQGARLPRDLYTWRLLFVQSILNSTGAWLLLAWGQRHIDSGLASVLNSTTPLFVFLITALVTRHEVASRVRLLGAVLGFIGVILIVGPDVLLGLGQQVAGQLAALAGAFLYGIAAIFGQRLSHLPATVTATGTILCAAGCLIPASLIIDQPWQLAPSPRAWLAAVVLGIACTSIALLIYFRLLRTLGSLGVASQAYLRAGVGVALGIVVLGEQITLVVGLGLAAALIGVALINLPPGRERSIAE